MVLSLKLIFISVSVAFTRPSLKSNLQKQNNLQTKSKKQKNQILSKIILTTLNSLRNVPLLFSLPLCLSLLLLPSLKLKIRKIQEKIIKRAINVKKLTSTSSQRLFFSLFIFLLHFNTISTFWHIFRSSKIVM